VFARFVAAEAFDEGTDNAEGSSPTAQADGVLLSEEYTGDGEADGATSSAPADAGTAYPEGQCRQLKDEVPPKGFPSGEAVTALP